MRLVLLFVMVILYKPILEAQAGFVLNRDDLEILTTRSPEADEIVGYYFSLHKMEDNRCCLKVSVHVKTSLMDPEDQLDNEYIFCRSAVGSVDFSDLISNSIYLASVDKNLTKNSRKTIIKHNSKVLKKHTKLDVDYAMLKDISIRKLYKNNLKREIRSVQKKGTGKFKRVEIESQNYREGFQLPIESVEHSELIRNIDEDFSFIPYSGFMRLMGNSAELVVSGASVNSGSSYNMSEHDITIIWTERTYDFPNGSTFTVFMPIVQRDEIRNHFTLKVENPKEPILAASINAFSLPPGMTEVEPLTYFATPCPPYWYFENH